jgi:hypothetical protein
MTSKMTTHRRAVDNVYQPEPAAMNNVMSSLEELEEPSSRRVSNISVASGIYEEILDDFVAPRSRRVPSNFYEDPEELILNSSVKLQPPPLPPRQRLESGSMRNGRLVPPAFFLSPFPYICSSTFPTEAASLAT